MSTYHELDKVIRALPPVAQKELTDFVNYLRFKHHLDPPGPVVKLGGLWADIDFDVTDDVVRSLRRRTSRQLAHKV